MRIAIIGYGGVGRALVELLVNKKEELKEIGLQVIYVIGSKGGIYNPEGIDLASLVEFSRDERDITKYPNGASAEVTFHKILENKDVDLVIELTPTNKETGEPGMTHIIKSLEKGFHVATANKGPILLNYKKLREIAIENNVQLCIGCTSGGALPTINGGIMDMAGSNVLSIEGVLNGTTNYIIKEMEDGHVSYDEALKKAQQMGIAETDPSLDVEGWDTASKLLIITNVIMKEEKTLKDISVAGITQLTKEDIIKAKEEGKKFKLVGRSIRKDHTLEMSVKLEKLEKDHPLYGVDGKNKGVRYTSDTLGDLTMIGGASGVTPAAASILRDLINIHRGYKF
ncbi:homoserine dehydrogenase [Alkaliphilus serpentinus]|uniref:Homoserine dehydrogenase n=1 Tax=Alkaliphilus serpentinus TaxID=1482731 RepID=A0A833HP72_9FIRM|nr:homoserine dehydrogenase [Alkaliphilus serpentinus]KAB3530325.1 homoserine dehydrogenase [Alkaliphilus serpentinus]